MFILIRRIPARGGLEPALRDQERAITKSNGCDRVCQGTPPSAGAGAELVSRRIWRLGGHWLGILGLEPAMPVSSWRMQSIEAGRGVAQKMHLRQAFSPCIDIMLGAISLGSLPPKKNVLVESLEHEERP